MRRKLAFIILMTLLLLCFTSVISCADKASDDRAGLLKALNIVDEAFENKEYITRGEFAVLVAKAMNVGYDENSIAVENPFADIYKYETGSQMFLHLKNLNIIKGDYNDNFNKNDLITFEQAYTICLRAMGYSSELEGDAETRTPMLMLTNLADINIGKTITSNVTAKDAIYVVFRMLHSKNFTLPGYLKNEIIVGGETFLEYYWKLKVSTGVVKANSITHISSVDKALAKNKIMINDVLYDDKSDYGLKLLGNNVKAYINSDDEVIYAYADRNNEFTVYSDDEPEYKDFSIKYTVNDSVKSLKLTKGFSIIYNGVASENIGHMNLKDGFIRLIDNNNDNVYDVAFVNEYKYIFVEAINTKECVILDTNNKKYKLDLYDDGEKTIRLYDAESKKEITVDEIGKNTILRCITDENQKYIEVYVSSASSSGNLTEINEEWISINGVSYEFNSYYQDYYGKTTVGAYGNFYFDDFGKVTAFVPTSKYAVMQFGYVMGAKRSTGIDKNLKLMILDTDGNKNDYVIKESCIVDGVKLKDGDVKLDNLFITQSGGTNFRLVRFASDESGVLTQLDTTESNNDYELYSTPTDVNDYLKITTSVGTKKYKSVEKMFLVSSDSPTSFRVDETTAVFAVPSEIGSVTQKDSYSSESFNSDIVFSNDGGYKIESYNVDKSGLAEAVVVYQSVATDVNSGSAIGVVYKTQIALNAEGAATTQIFYYDGKTFNDVLLTDEAHALGNTYKPGDVIRYEKDKKGLATVVKVDYSHERGVDFVSTTGADAAFEVKKLIPYYMKDGFVIAKSGNSQYLYNLNKGSKIEFNETTGNVSATTVDSVKCVSDYENEASEIFIVLNYSTPRAVIIYNK